MEDLQSTGEAPSPPKKTWSFSEHERKKKLIVFFFFVVVVYGTQFCLVRIQLT